MKKNNNNLVAIGGIVLVFATIMAGFYLRSFHSEIAKDLNKKVIKTSGGAYRFALFTLDSIKDDESTRMFIGLKPGETFESSLGIKNHDMEGSHSFRVNVESGETKEGKDNKPEEANKETINSLIPYIKLPTIDFNIEPEEVALVKYKISIPKDTPKGTYRALVSTYISDPSAPAATKDGVNLMLRMGLPITVYVDENPKRYEYEHVLAQADTIALNATILRARYILAMLLAVASVFAVFFYFKRSKT